MNDPRKSLLTVPVQTPLHAAVKLAAEQEMTTISEFVRRTLIEKVRSRGIDPHDARTSTRPAAASAGPAAAVAERHATA
jgi:hypothetical protein